MTSPLSWILHLCALPCLLLIASCVDIREEFWIHDDGSAEAEVICDMPRNSSLIMGGPKGVKAIAEKIMANEPCVDSYEVHVSEHDKRLKLRIRCEIDELMSLEQLRDSIARNKELPESVRKMVGEFEVGVKGLTHLAVSRTVNPGEALPALRWIPKSKLEGHSITKIMHFPYRIEEHNAHEQWDDGQTLSWKTPLASAIQGPVVYEFTIPAPIPWPWVIAAASILTLLSVAAIWMLRGLIKKRRA
ncbi:MAG: hypothetical protein R3242_03375 [Akkermansiaceae bacterium]|nr:hypothetical protein [Akkermansiaceae bacterium]